VGKQYKIDVISPYSMPDELLKGLFVSLVNNYLLILIYFNLFQLIKLILIKILISFNFINIFQSIFIYINLFQPLIIRKIFFHKFMLLKNI